MVNLRRLTHILFFLPLILLLLTSAHSKNEPDVTRKNQENILQAAMEGDLKTAKALLGGDPSLANAKDDAGMTPLLWATRGGQRHRHCRRD